MQFNRRCLMIPYMMPMKTMRAYTEPASRQNAVKSAKSGKLKSHHILKSRTMIYSKFLDVSLGTILRRKGHLPISQLSWSQSDCVSQTQDKKRFVQKVLSIYHQHNSENGCRFLLCLCLLQRLSPTSFWYYENNYNFCPTKKMGPFITCNGRGRKIFSCI